MTDTLKAAYDRWKDRAYDHILIDANRELEMDIDSANLADAYVELMSSRATETQIIDKTITLSPVHADLRGMYSDISLLLASADEPEPLPDLEFGKRYRIRIEEITGRGNASN